jgi:hypothetical protein
MKSINELVSIIFEHPATVRQKKSFLTQPGYFFYRHKINSTLKNMRNLLLVSLILFMNVSFGQSQTTITTIDFVKMKNNNRQEALFFYENNWKIFRDIALEKGYITSYKLLTTSSDTTANFDLILVTEYADSLQFKLSEERFQQIIKASRPDGLKLLNELKPNDFRQNLFFKQAETLFSEDKSKK